jgi:hypothetical protein
MLQKTVLTKDATQFNTLTVKIGINPPYVVACNGTLRAVVYSDSAGPSAELIGSNTLTVVNNVIAGVGIISPINTTDALAIPFTFTSQDALGAGTYWVGIEFVPSVVGGTTLPQPSRSSAAVTDSCYYNDGNGTWVDNGYAMYYSASVTYGTFTTVLSVPATVNAIKRIYDTDTLTEMLDKKDGEALISETWRSRGIESDGTWDVEVSRSGVVYWNMEVKTAETDLSDDTDEILIPNTYVDSVLYGAEMLARGEGWGLNGDTKLIILDKKYNAVIGNMEMNLRPEFDSVGIDESEEGYTPTGCWVTKPVNGLIISQRYR